MGKPNWARDSGPCLAPTASAKIVCKSLCGADFDLALLLTHTATKHAGNPCRVVTKKQHRPGGSCSPFSSTMGSMLRAGMLGFVDLRGITSPWVAPSTQSSTLPNGRPLVERTLAKAIGLDGPRLNQCIETTALLNCASPSGLR